MRIVKSLALCLSTLLMVYAIADYIGMNYQSSLIVGFLIAFGWPWPERGRP